MTGLTLTVVGCGLVLSLWSGLGPPWHWPGMLLRAVHRGGRRAVRASVARLRRPAAEPGPDPFVILQLQHRLGLIATELRILESEDADRVYYARAHRIQTRRTAYDQLLTEACRLAGVTDENPGHRLDNDGGLSRTEDERFAAEIELAARGWHW